MKFSPPVNRAVTSKDVKYAIERGFFNTVNNGYAGAYFGDLEGAKVGVKPGTKIKGIETPDDQTIVFKLDRAVGGVMAAGALAMPATAPVPEEYAAKFDAENPTTYGENQVATGPYMIENDAAGKAIGYKPGKRIHLVRNPNWDKSTDYKPAYLDEIDNLEGNDDPGVASRRILTGKSMVNGDFSPPPETLKQALDAARKDQLSSSRRRRPLDLAEHDDQAVRRHQRPQGRHRRLRPQRAAPGARRQAGRRHRRRTTSRRAWPASSEAGGMKGPAWTSCSTDGQPQPGASPPSTSRRRAIASGKYEGNEKILMVGSNAGVAAKVAEVAKEQLREAGLQGQDAPRRAQHDVHAVLQRPRRANVAVCPNVGWLKDFADAPDDARPDVQRQEHPSGRATPTGPSSTTRRSTTRWTRPSSLAEPERARAAWADDRQAGQRAGSRDPVHVGQEPGDPLRQRQWRRHAQLRAVGHLVDVAQVSKCLRPCPSGQGRDRFSRERP